MKSDLAGVRSVKQQFVQKFIIGIGMSEAGAKELGETLANMRLGDIQAYLAMRDLDPVTTMTLMTEHAQLMCTIVRVKFK